MKYQIIKDLKSLQMFASVFHWDRFSFDTETTDVKYGALQIVGLSMHAEGMVPTYIQFNFSATYTVKEKDPNNPKRKIDVVKLYEHTEGIDFDKALPYLLSIFTDRKVVCHNAKFDYKVAHKYKFDTFILDGDTMLMCYLIDVNTPNGLKYNVNKYLTHKMTEYADVTGMKLDNIIWSEVDFEAYGEYGASDAFYTWELEKRLMPEMKKYDLMDTYREIELPIVRVVGDMEIAGVKIDVAILKAMSIELHKEIKKSEEYIYDLAGIEFNIGSTKQLAEVLFERLGYPIIKQTAKGAVSCDEETLKELAYKGYEVADAILSYRTLAKLASTYVDKIPEMLDDDGRLRGNFNQIGARTGRFSSSEPNLQNQPNNKKFPVRSAFVAEAGYDFVILDWSTIEIRVMAHESGDPVLTKILRQGRDIHQETADRIGAIAGLLLTRQQGKTLNFAILYGMWADSLMATLNEQLKEMVKEGKMTAQEYRLGMITKRNAEKIIKGFYTAYSGFDRWCKEEIANAKAVGYVRTIGKRIRKVPELYAKQTAGEGSRIVINTKIQGGAGDLMKIAIRKISNHIEAKMYDARILMVVHDEFIIEARKNISHRLFAEVKIIMENIFPNCTVPIKAEGDIFGNWAGMKNGSKGIKKNDMLKNISLQMLNKKLKKLQ